MTSIMKWLPRVGLLTVAALIVVVGAIWFQGRGESEDIKRLERAYQYALSDTRSREAAYRMDRQGFRTDSANAQAVVYRYRSLRDTLDLTDTNAVAIALSRADRAADVVDSVIASSARALTSADSVISAKDREIGILRTLGKVSKPPRITPWAEVLYDPYSNEYRVRGGIDTRIVRRVSVVVAGEAGKNGPSALVGGRITF